jgi:3-oxoacyl-[acyl-carrier-protein] synthase-1
VNPLLLSHFTATSCLGRGLDATLAALKTARSGLTPCDFDTAAIPTWIGRVAGLEDALLPAELQRFDCRNHRLAQLGLHTDGFADAVAIARQRYGAERIGVFLGTSTSGIYETEVAYRQRDPASGALPASFNYFNTHTPYSLADFVRHALALKGPAAVVSTACSSSAKVFASAQRMIELGLIDAAVVGGVDSLCLTTLYGFTSLELTSPEPCRPYDAERQGISIGEGAAFILLERAPTNPTAGQVLLLGAGESSDAYHMSSPHPEGQGAQAAMAQAMQRAGVSAAEIDYINCHGTATPSNDAAEGRAIATLFGATIPCSSTKGATGHTLGAAGGVEAVICALALQNGLIPGSAGTRQLDPALAIDYVLSSRQQTLRRVLSNSFGFGGSNCSLLFGLSS